CCIRKSLALSIVLLFTLVIEAREYPTDKNGNVNVNVIDRQVIVNDKVVDVLEPGEPIEVDVDDIGVDLDDEKIGVDVEDDVSVRMGRDIAVDVDDEISVNLGGLGDFVGSIIGDDD
ncbi:MAG: hypothetical protein K0U38_02925, partial [Epsilonproteobacteria bacterium]|nr:hypothetical protein [Campylobacterota bacterium]